MVSCTACDAVALPEPFFYIWKDREWGIHRCTACTLQFVWPQVTDEDRALIFGDDYFSAEGDWACGWFGAYDEAEDHLRAEARVVLRQLGAPVGRLLDIGCAGGVFADEARSHGWDVCGIEFNAGMAARAAALGVLVWNGPAEDAPIDVFGEPFDAVVLMDTLEHVPSPGALMARVAAWTQPGSRLLIRGPISNRRIDHLKERARRLLRVRKQLPGYPLDANMWSPRSLEHLVRRHGFALARWHGTLPGFGTLTASRVE